MNYCFLDLETTGFDAEKDSIIEISFILQDDQGNELDRFDEVIIPDRSPLNTIVTKITGITQTELDQSGKHWEAIRHIAEQKIGDAIIVGHNIDFDIRFLIAHGINVEQNPRIDTHELARILLVQEESYALEILSEKYGFVHTDAHRAMSDVEASIGLYGFLKQKIEELPTSFLESIQPFFENKTEWYAKTLFTQIAGSPTIPEQVRPPLPPAPPMAESWWERLSSHLPDLSPGHSLFVRQGDSLKGADFLRATAQHLIDEKQQVLIVSPKLSFFPGIQKIPTPEVLFDPQRLQFFLQKREALSDSDTTFYLKCAHRHFLGYRGLDHFDLFFQERDLWREVCLEDDDHPIFQNLLRERETEDLLAISPEAFFRFSDQGIFKDRVLLIDEGELFAEKLLFAPAKNVNLGPYLRTDDEEIAKKTQFFVGNFCKEVIEPKIQHGMTPFPERLRLPRGATYSVFSEALREISSDGEMKDLATKLESPGEKDVRWVVYYPETGNLNFGWWNPEDWREAKQKLGAWKKIILHRHHPSGSNAFFRVFTGVAEGSFLVCDDFFPERSWEIPFEGPSVKSPEFNAFTVEQALKIQSETGGWWAVNFSSLESLKKVFGSLSEVGLPEDISLIGEKVSGGNGKILEKLKVAEKALLCHQKMLQKELTELPIKALIIQKFPFSPPHPLLEEIEEVMKQSKQSFWEEWTEVHVTAHLSRTLSVFPQVEKVVFLDSRHNSGWGKRVIKSQKFLS